MAGQAQVTSVEAIAAFRAALVLFQAKARSTAEEISNEILRTRQWLQHEGKNSWVNEQRQRQRKLERLQNELFEARLSKLQEASPVQVMAVKRAEREVEEVRTKLAVLKKWERELDHRSEPLLKQVERLHNVLTGDLPRAIASLDLTVRTLESYAETAPPAGGAA